MGCRQVAEVDDGFDASALVESAKNLGSFMEQFALTAADPSRKGEALQVPRTGN